MAGAGGKAEQLDLRVRRGIIVRDLAVGSTRHDLPIGVDEERAERWIAAGARLAGELHRLADQRREYQRVGGHLRHDSPAYRPR